MKYIILGCPEFAIFTYPLCNLDNMLKPKGFDSVYLGNRGIDTVWAMANGFFVLRRLL